MNEYKATILELALANGKKAKRIKKLEAENKELEEQNRYLIHDLDKARSYAQMLKNDLKDLSKEFTQWKSQREKEELKQS